MYMHKKGILYDYTVLSIHNDIIISLLHCFFCADIKL